MEGIVTQLTILVEKVSIIYQFDYIIILIKIQAGKTRLRKLIHKYIQTIQILYNTQF